MRTLLFITVVVLSACATQKKTSTVDAGTGDTRTKPVELIDDRTYLLIDATDDKTYGYDKANPVKVGGSKQSTGPVNERRYLNALEGPEGQEVKYFRAGSCCHFKTPNGPFNNIGLLDRYRISWYGSKDTLDIYINMYDEGDLKIPVGLKAKTKGQ
jgi:hypothetical protein